MTEKPAYDNFDLQIGPGDGGVYPVSVPYSPAGETAEPVLVPIRHDDEATNRWLRRLRSGFTERDDLVGLGRQLTGYLLPAGQVYTLYQRSLGRTGERNLGLRMRLRIQPPELAALPWEYAYDQDSDDFFVLNRRTVLVRYHSQPIPPLSIIGHAPVPILVLISNPARTHPLDTVRQVRNLVGALGRLLDEGKASLDLLFTGSAEERREVEGLVARQAGAHLLPGPASIDALRDALRQGHRIVHYYGHGAFDAVEGGALLMDDNQGNISLVQAQTLARELRGSSARVVVLNACQSATEGTARSFMGLAPSLIKAEVPAVVAMQFPILDSSATYFSHALYKALADGWPLDAAVTEGRKAIGARLTEDDMDWGIPVLFMRSESGELWRVESEEAVAEGEPEVDRAAGARADRQMSIQGETVTLEGDLALGNIYKDSVFGDAAQVKKYETKLGDVGPGAQVAIGEQIEQTVVQAPAELTDDERTEIEQLLAELKRQLGELDLPERKKHVAQDLVEELETELTRTDAPPNANTLQYAGDWLLRNIPALAGTLSGLFVHPVVGKVVEAAGDLATGWIRMRFGSGV
jgi:hypothetical protein